MIQETTTKPMSNSQTVYQAIVDLSNASKPASRQRISQITGLRMSLVDDHIKSLKRLDKIRLVVNGVFEPVFAAQNDRAVSITFTPFGTVKLEVGDHCLDLTLREARAVGNGTAGLTMLFGR